MSTPVGALSQLSAAELAAVIRFAELAAPVIRQTASRSRHLRDLDAVVYIDTPCWLRHVIPAHPLGLRRTAISFVTSEIKETGVTKVITDCAHAGP